MVGPSIPRAARSRMDSVGNSPVRSRRAARSAMAPRAGWGTVFWVSGSSSERAKSTPRPRRAPVFGLPAAGGHRRLPLTLRDPFQSGQPRSRRVRRVHWPRLRLHAVQVMDDPTPDAPEGPASPSGPETEEPLLVFVPTPKAAEPLLPQQAPPLAVRPVEDANWTIRD